MTTESADALVARARAWAESDPDLVTRTELEALLASNDLAELAECMGPELDFGTAGLRGPVGAGPARMNRAVILRAARAIAETLIANVPDAHTLCVVVGFDARKSSRQLAEAAAGVLLAAGIVVRWFDSAVPTPLVAYATRVLGAAAALVVTASHNSREDNGLKVYGGDGIQLGPPTDAEVARRRDALGPANGIPCIQASELQVGSQGARFCAVPSDLFARYLNELQAALPVRHGKGSLRIAYTPLHGLGFAPLWAALQQRGFHDLHVVSEQAQPDGNFPTAPFPNPELPGTLDRVLELAERVGAELVLANDPDVDRLAAAAPVAGGRFHVLTGNELGALLADFVLDQASATPRPLLVTSVVSSPLLLSIARAHGAASERTLTGFKWIWAAARTLEARGEVKFAFGCEEALGYSIGGLVRDKDGISAALWLAELALHCRAQGQSLVDRLLALYRQHGAWSSAHHSLAFPGRAGAARLEDCLQRLAAAPPKELCGERISNCVDYQQGAASRPVWLGAARLFELEFGAAGRVLVRPSGTEPKLKVYADAQETVAHGEPAAAAAARSRARAESLASGLADWLTATPNAG